MQISQGKCGNSWTSDIYPSQHRQQLEHDIVSDGYISSLTSSHLRECIKVLELDGDCYLEIIHFQRLMTGGTIDQ